MPKYRDSGNRLVISGRDLVKALHKRGYKITGFHGDEAVMRDGVHVTNIAVRGRGKDELGAHELSIILRQTELSKSDIIGSRR